MTLPSVDPMFPLRFTVYPEGRPLLAFLRVAIRIAALLHDLGKATRGFQGKLWTGLRGERTEKDALRHELVSVMLMDVDDPERFLQAVLKGEAAECLSQRAAWLGSNEVKAQANEWLSAVAALGEGSGLLNETARLDFFAHKLSFNQREKWLENPFWMSVLWLIYTHHKLLRGHWSEHLHCFAMTPESHANPSRVSDDDSSLNLDAVNDFLTMSQSGQPWDDQAWLAQFTQAMQDWQSLRLQYPDYEATLFRADASVIGKGLGESTPWIKSLTRMGRLSLVMGDYEASCDAIKGHQLEPNEITLYANTKDIGDTRHMGDALHTHLLKTHHYSSVIFDGLFVARSPDFFKPGTLSYANSPAALKAVTTDPSSSFVWQSHAQKAMEPLRQHQRGGFFVVASGTGSGKTKSCAGMMAASREDARFSVMLSMRSLTFQTAKAYLADNIGYHPNQVAMFVGDDVLKRRFREESQKRRKQLRDQERSNEERYSVLYNGPTRDVLALESLKDDHFLMRSLSAPVSIMTVDHVIRAINLAKSSDLLQMLNLMSTDLILDEIDDYRGQDLVSIGRLIELAGQFGRRVIIASATLPKTIVEGFYKAYCEGYTVYQEAYGIEDPETVVITHTAPYAGSPSHGQTFIDFYEKTMTAFCANEKAVANACPRRSSVDVTPLLSKFSQKFSNSNHPLAPHMKDVSKVRPGAYSRYSKALAQRYYFQALTASAFEGHRLNLMQHGTMGYSAGAIRLNSVVNAQAYMNWMASSGVREAYEKAGVGFKLMCYHAQNIGLARYQQEAFLDNHLKRASMNQGHPDPFLASKDVQESLSRAEQGGLKHVIFIIVTTSIFETGRDYDLDWAVLEPCSTTSIVQFAGRVRRHRSQAHSASNVMLMPCSLESMINPAHAWRDLKHTPFAPKASPDAKHQKALIYLGISYTGALVTEPVSTQDAFAQELTRSHPMHAGHCLMTPSTYAMAPLTSMERIYQLSLFEKNYASDQGVAYTLEYALHHADAVLCDTFYRSNPFRGDGDIIRLEYLPQTGWVSQDEQGHVKSINESVFNQLGAAIDHPEMYLISALNFSGCEEMVALSEDIGRELGYQADDLSLASSALLSTQRDRAHERLTFHPQLGFFRCE